MENSPSPSIIFVQSIRRIAPPQKTDKKGGVMISWSDYIILVALCLGAYYIFILVKHFPEKIKTLLRSREKPTPENNEESSDPDTQK